MTAELYGEEFMDSGVQVDPSTFASYEQEKGGLQFGQKEAAEAVAGYEFGADYSAQRDAGYQSAHSRAVSAGTGLSRKAKPAVAPASGSAKPTPVSTALSIVNPDGMYNPGDAANGLLPSARMDASRIAQGKSLLDRDQQGATYADLDRKKIQALSRSQDQGMKAFQQRNFLAQRARQRGLSSYSATEAPPEQEYRGQDYG